MPLKLRIPERYVATLSQFVRLSPEELAAFLRAIREEEPTLALNELTESMARNLDIDQKRMAEIVRVLADLQTVREGFGLPVKDFVAELRAAIDATNQEDLQPTDWEAFESAVTEALSGDNALAVSSKARSVTGEFQNLYCSSRVLTDFRPIFRPDLENQPAAFVVVHTLRITYHTSEDHRELYVALDKDDLDTLAIQIDRARKKEASLNNLGRDKDLRVLEVK